MNPCRASLEVSGPATGMCVSFLLLYGTLVGSHSPGFQPTSAAMAACSPAWNNVSSPRLCELSFNLGIKILILLRELNETPACLRAGTQCQPPLPDLQIISEAFLSLDFMFPWALTLDGDGRSVGKVGPVDPRWSQGMPGAHSSPGTQWPP